jgi:hypothetical protein
MTIRTVQLTTIQFDCYSDDDDWTEQDQAEREKYLHDEYIGQVFEVDLDEDYSEEDLVYELCEEISTQSGWLVSDIDFRYVLK